MTLRTSLQRLIGRDPARLTLRQRAAETAARLAASKPAADAATADPPSPEAVTAQLDPTLSVIEEGRRLLSASREAFKLPDIDLDPHPDREAAQNAVWAHFRGPISSTVPTTARGCAELARYAGEFREFQGVELGDELATILANIARSPMLKAGAREGRQAEPAPATLGRAKHSFVEQVDFASASVAELRTIHEKMRHLSDVAYAMASQACCEGARRNSFFADRNAAGSLLHWLGDALTGVESAAGDELQRRQPEGLDDRCVRLAAIAELIIYSDDIDEMAAFIRELTAFAADVARC